MQQFKVNLVFYANVIFSLWQLNKLSYGMSLRHLSFFLGSISFFFPYHVCNVVLSLWIMLSNFHIPPLDNKLWLMSGAICKCYLRAVDEGSAQWVRWGKGGRRSWRHTGKPCVKKEIVPREKFANFLVAQCLPLTVSPIFFHLWSIFYPLFCNQYLGAICTHTHELTDKQ